jgi:CRP-like cAMP-binding protein
MLFSDPRCEGCVVRGTIEGGALAVSGLQQVLQRSEYVTLRAKQRLYAQGAPADALFALRRGTVKLLRAEGAEPARLVRWMKSGAVVGLEAATGAAYRHTAVAIEPVEFCRIPLPVVRHLESAGPSFYRALLRQCQAGVDEADSFIATLVGGTSAQKLARLLLKLGAMHDGRYCVSLMRNDIGAALGMSMETASRLMAQFRRRGMFRAAGRQLHCDREALRKIADLP